MCNGNSVTTKMRHWTIVLTLMVVVVASSDEYTDKLPITEEQMHLLTEIVCMQICYDGQTDIDENKMKICQEEFLNPKYPPIKSNLFGVNGVMTSDSTVSISLPPSKDHRRLVVLVPANDSTAIINFGLLGPSETSFETDVQGQKDLQIWSTTLDSSEKRGLWRRGPKIGNWCPSEFRPYIVEFKDNFTVVGNNVRNVRIKVEFVWNGTEKDSFIVTNLCQKANSGLFQTTTREKSVMINDLKLNDHCTIAVEGTSGNGSLEYDTPTEIDGFWEVQVPKISSVSSVRGENDWEVTVSWSAPAHPVTQYNVTVNANNTRTVVVGGNMTSAVLSNVLGEDIYSVTLVAVTPMGNGHTTRRAIFPRINETNGLTIVGAWCVLLLVTVTGAMLWWRKRRQDKAPTIVQEYPYKKCPLGADSVSDAWEVGAERLRLREVIGEGEFGVVRRAILAPAGKEVAVKMLKEYPTLEEIRSFRSEMELMKCVGVHAHVVSLVGCCTHRPMVVTEYCSRGNLLKYLRSQCHIMISKRNANYYNNNVDPLKNQTRDNPKIVVNKLYDLQGGCDAELTPVDLLSFCRQIAMGMEFLASNRVVHRDLAARNVLVTEDKTLKIADFGLSRDVYQDNKYEQKGKAKLPIKWMAIESLTRRVYTSQSDVWSFGVVMWEVVTAGGSPYPGVCARRLPPLLQSGYRMPRPSNCSKHLYEVMQCCWRARARDRPTFAELHRTLDAMLNSACAGDYLSLDLEANDAPTTPRLNRYLGLLARTKRYWSNKSDNMYNKAEIYERPLNTQSNHYTSPPDTLSRVKTIHNTLIYPVSTEVRQ